MLRNFIFSVFFVFISLFSIKTFGSDNNLSNNTTEKITTAPGDFTLSGNSTGEKCTGDGTVIVSVANGLDGATYSIKLYNASNLSVIKDTYTTTLSGFTNFDHTFLGLTAATYFVEVTESIVIGANTYTSTKSFTVIVGNYKKTLVYSLTHTLNCDNTYNLTAKVTDGYPSTFELRSADGSTVIVPAQTSNIFTGIALGSYLVVATDICGQKTNVSYDVTVLPPWTLAHQYNYTSIKDCNNYYSTFYLYSPGGNVKTPLNYTITFTANGTPYTITGTYTYTGGNYPQITYVAPIPTSGSYVATMNVTDGCGKNYTFTQTIYSITRDFKVSKTPTVCGYYIQFQPINMTTPITVKLTSFPAGFIPSQYNSAFNDTTNTAVLNWGFDLGSTTKPLPLGTYTGTATDSCGFTVPFSFTIDPPVYDVSVFYSTGCTDGKGNARLMVSPDSSYQVANITSATVTSAPAGFSGPYSLVIINGQANLNDVPEGTYTVEVKFNCNGVDYTITKTFDVYGLKVTKSEVTVVPGCSSFSFTVDYTSNSGYGQFWIQKFDPVKGLWTDPVYGGSDQSSPINYNNAHNLDNDRYNNYINYMVNSKFTIYNFAYSGHFRIVLVTTANSIPCYKVIGEFDSQPVIKLNDYYVFRCGTDKVSLAIDASGTSLTYEIIEKNGVAISISNGANPVFTNIDPGVYKVRVTDHCGSTKIFTFFASSSKLPNVTANLCNGSPGTISLPVLNFMNVSWSYNGGSLPANVTMNATNNYTINFASYNKTNQLGTYTATLTYQGSVSCEPIPVSFTLTNTNDTNPIAGTGNTVEIDGSNLTGPINLYDALYLTGPYDGNGTWVETTAVPSNFLNGNNWYANLANSGTYTFKYIVNGTCSGSANTTVTLKLNKVCYKTPITDGNTYPASQGITALARAGTQNDNWPMVRQSAHSVLESKNSGFVLNKVDFDATGNPVGIPSSNWVEGMAVYDNTNKCLKVYFGTTKGWKCLNKKACPNN